MGRMGKKPEKWSMSLRATTVHRDAIKALAGKDSRSTNWWIVRAIDEKLARDKAVSRA
jgi:hypothetical protein